MPELPEVETIRIQLAPRLCGRTISDTWNSDNAKFTAAVAAHGAQIGELRRRGKYLIGSLSGNRELIIHLGMTGVLRFGQGAPRDAHVRVAFTLDDGSVLELHDVRQFGRLSVVDAGDYRSLPTLHALGPEPFDAAFTPAALHRALGQSRARIKTQLLNQRVVAGVGNIYADEALWRAQIYPAARSVSRPQAARLHGALIAALHQGIANGGTTLRDYRSLDGATGANQNSLDCYGRAGAACRRCGEPLRRRVLDGRATTFCPRCQRSR